MMIHGVGQGSARQIALFGGPQGWYGSGYNVRGTAISKQAAEAGRVDGVENPPYQLATDP
jgi:hypothetical protein